MKIMDIIPDKYTKMDTWEKDGVLMCSKECCGAPVSECSCGPECKHCNCYELKKVDERYGMRQGVAQGRTGADTVRNMNKRLNNKNQDMGREQQISQLSSQRRINRLQRKIATGIPQRLINPQQAAGNET